MDIFFPDPSEVRLPPAEVRIRELRAEPWPDGRRVRVALGLTPFQKRPGGELRITDAQGREVAALSFIETITPKMELTMHLRVDEPAGQYTLSATIFYSAPLPPPSAESLDQPIELPEAVVVDQKTITFVGNCSATD